MKENFGGEVKRPIISVNHNRSMIDVLREIPGFLAGDLFKGARNLLHEKMTTVKQNMETLYQTK